MKIRVFGAALAFASALGSLLLASPARAQDSALGGPRRPTETPQNFAAEIRLGQYLPDVDSESGLAGRPFEETFGTKKRWMIGGAFEWQAIRIPYFGTIGPGGSFGYTRLTARAFVDPAAQGAPQAGRLPDRSGDETTMVLLPIFAYGVARVDTFDRNLGIPIVPYVKAGLGCALWRSEGATGTSRVDGVAARGYTFGYMLAGGVAFNLNPLDPYTAKNFDSGVGVNHTYLFAEWSINALNGIGQSNALRLGDSTWTAGLAFDF